MFAWLAVSRCWASVAYFGSCGCNEVFVSKFILRSSPGQSFTRCNQYCIGCSLEPSHCEAFMNRNHTPLHLTKRYLSLIKSIRKSCQRCHFLNKKFAGGMMGPISNCQLTIAPAFYSTQVDLSGPYLTYSPLHKRITVNIWLTVFCCCLTSAVQVRVTDSYSADAFIINPPLDSQVITDSQRSYIAIVEVTIGDMVISDNNKFLSFILLSISFVFVVIISLTHYFIIYRFLLHQNCLSTCIQFMSWYGPVTMSMNQIYFNKL